MNSSFLKRLLVSVAGMTTVASAQVTRLIVETSLDGVSWVSGTRGAPAGSTLQFRYVVTFDPSGTTQAPIGFAALTFQPTVSNWSTGETLAAFATTGNNLNGGSVSDSSGLFGRIIPFAATGPTTTDPYRGHTQAVSGVNYLRLARTTITNWIGVGATSGTSAANNTNGAGGVVCVQKGVNALNTSDPAFNGSISGVVLAKFGMTLSADTSPRTLVFDAPLGGMSRNTTTGVREASWYSSTSDLVGTIKGAVAVTPAEVFVCQPPVITSQPASVAACAGTQTTLSVSATNATAFQWRKGGVDIAGATNATLPFASLSSADAGTYDCVVTNGCITVTSSTATLTVNTVPGITAGPASTAACVGSGANFSVTAVNAASFQWRKGGANIPGATVATLSINPVVAGSEGSYDCVVTNGCGSVTTGAATLTVNTVPVIGGQPGSTTSCEGGSATFSVAASGATSFQWRKGGVNIPGATAATLTINPVVAGSAGSYDCVATNACGSVASSAATLGVLSPLTVASQPSSVDACEGLSASLSFVVSGSGPVTYRWTRNGTDIPGATASILSFAALTTSDAGTYVCVATGACGSISSSSVSVAVKRSLVVTTQPASLVKCAGEAASFSVAVTGTGPITYRWTRNGTTIPGANAATYSLASTTEADGGSYACVIEGTCNAVTSSAATLDVRTPVTIVTQPSTVSACTGQSATLGVSASGTGPLAYSWRKNGSPVAGATGSSLSFASLSASDSGSYDCVVTGPCNSVTSSAVAINVGTPPAISTQPVAVAGCEGTVASLSVAATGTAPLTFQWKRDGVDVPGATSSTLSFASLSAADAGSYVCTVTNGCSSVASSAAAVTVRARVAFTLQPQSVTTCVGSTASFSVSATGAGPLTYQWKRNGANISGATSASLSFTSVTVAQAGTFTCEVTGTCGSLVSSAATLTVQSPLTWSQQPSSASAAVGQSVTLAAQASGTGSIVYQWRKNGINIQGATSSSLVFASLVPSDSGSYVCIATGICGSITSNAADVSAITLAGANPGRCGPVQLLDPNGAANDFFGSVASSGDLIVAGAARDTVGANALQGSAGIYRWAASGWTREASLSAADGAAQDGFGNAVAADGDTVVVAASNARVSGNNSRGAVYVFVRTGTTWAQQAKLVASDGAAGDAFGATDAIDGDAILVGAPTDDLSAADAGSAYVFTRSGTVWTQRQKLVAADVAANALFGSSVAINADRLVVGAPGAMVSSVRRGAAYGFARGGNSWAQIVKFVDPTGAQDDRFGAAVAVEDDRVLVGAPSDDVGSNADQGSACSFVGWTGVDCVKITDSSGAAGDFFGSSLAIRGGSFVVGAPQDDNGSNADQGSALVFEFAGSSANASCVARLTAPGGAAGDRAGESVAFFGDRVVMGVRSDDVGGNADQGSAWVFDLCPGHWNWLAGDQRLNFNGAADGASEATDAAGSSVSVDGDLMAIGMPNDDAPGQTDRGSVRVLVRQQGEWVHRATLVAPAPVAGGRFGAAVSVSGPRLAVGAPGQNGGQGAAFVFLASGSSFTLEQTFVAADGAAGDAFGSAVALSIDYDPNDLFDHAGDVLAIGAPGADVNGNVDQGAAYAYGRVGATWSSQRRLLDPAGSPFDAFGSSVATTQIMAADDWDSPLRVIAVGEPLDDGSAGIDQGSVVVFVGGEEWYFRQKLSTADAAPGDAFGSSVSLDRGVMAVGVPADDVAGRIDQGSVVVFVGGEEWYFRQKLASSSGAAGDRLGASVSLHDGLLAAGSPGDDVGIAADAGSIASFARVGASWVQQETLVATDVVSGAGLGSAVSVAQDRVVGGAPAHSSASAAGIGAAWIFDAPSQCVAQATNLTTGVGVGSLATSILSARTGDTLTVTPAAFAAVSSVDTVGKSLAMVSTGNIRTTSTSVLTLGGASSLTAADGSSVEINGRLLTSSGATGYIAGDRFSLGAKGSLTARLNSSVLVDSFSAGLLGAFRVETNGSATFSAANVTSVGSMRVDQGGSLAFDGSLAFASNFVAAADSMVSAQGAIDVHGTMSVTNAQISSSLLFNRDILELSGAVSVYGPTVNLDDMRVFGSSALFGDFTNELGATTTVRSGTLFLFGSLTNNGTIVGTLCDNCTGLPPGMDVGGDLILGSEATLILPFQGSTLNLGGSFDCSIDSNERFDLSLATVQLEGRGAEQSFEAMSLDIGSLESGLDRATAGQFPIGTLRIGPTPSVVRLVDARDNDGNGQEFSCEAIYVDTLEIKSGSRLINGDCIKIYYRTLILEGTVDNPDNLVVYAPPCFSDFNRDGGVDFLDIEAFFGAWETGDASADVNLDGGIDGTDLELFIAQWENGC